MTQTTQQGGTASAAPAKKPANGLSAILATALIGAFGAILSRHTDLPEDESDFILQGLEKLAGALFR